MAIRKASPRKYVRKKTLVSEKADFLSDQDRLFNTIISYALELGCYDLHLEYAKERMRLRWRLEGKLHELFTFDSDQADRLKAQLIEKFGLAVNGKLPYQEACIRYEIGGKHVFLVLNAVNLDDGERFLLKIEQSKAYKIDDLQLLKSQQKILDDIMKASSVLAIGSVRSGDRERLLKTLASAYKERGETAALIMDHASHDWEDGDYLMVKPEIGFDRMTAVRVAMKSDTDLIMVDHVSKAEELDLLLEAAQAGKKIIIALPWDSQSKLFYYLWHLASDREGLRQVLKGFLLHKSLPGLCPHCRKHRKLSQQGQAAVDEIVREMSGNLNAKEKSALGGNHFYMADGCHFCKQTGHQGKTDLNMVIKLRRIPKNKRAFNSNELINWQNAITLRQLAVLKAAEGKADLLDALSFNQ